ncbi:MAG: M64 family metallopeptidase [Candidatus Woesearchaeota archaeon]
MLIQSVSAISNVQHSVDGKKVIITYQGIPPFWINIREDTNIGQAGGYLWAKTYSNSFSYDMSFTINPSKKFYYGIKDTNWSSTSNFLIGEIGFQKCAELIPGYNNPLANRINLIFVGFGYENISGFPNKIIYNLSYNMIMQPDRGLFSIEPFKSNINKFNLWYIGQSGVLTDCSRSGAQYVCDDSFLIKGCPINNRYKVHLINSIYAAHLGGNPITIMSSIEPELCDSRCRATILVHEFGHSFGGLLDEYVYNPAGVADYLISDSDKNCYAGPTHTKEECLLQAPWKDLIGNGCSQDGIIDCTPENPKYDQEIGCYEGCNYLGLGIFRPTRASFMLDGGRYPFFGQWNEKLLQKKLDTFD